jgi:neutral ceramidase
MLRLMWISLIVALLPPVAPIGHAADLLPIGVAKIDITPEGPIRLCGYASRSTESAGVAKPLRASALAIGNDSDGPALLIVAELVGVPELIVGPLAKRLRKAGIDRSRLAVCATHTHSGPCLAGFLNETHFSAYLPADQMTRIKAYTARLLDRLEAVALAALKDRRPGSLSWNQGKVGFAINRRRLKDGKWAGFGRVPEGPVDHALPVLQVRNPDGSLRAVLANYACHCTTYGGKFNQIHGDWAGSAARQIEERHPGGLAFITIGCGGDANPDPSGQVEGSAIVDAHGKAVADEVDRLLAADRVVLGALPVCRLQRIDLPLDHVPSRAELEGRLKGRKRPAFYARILLNQLDQGKSLPASFSYPVQTWTFGDDLAMVFLAGEVVVDYSLRLKRELSGQRLWITAYANDAPGYIASRRVIGEGGYEVDDSMNNYQQPTRLALSAEDLIIDTVKELLPAGFSR